MCSHDRRAHAACARCARQAAGGPRALGLLSEEARLARRRALTRAPDVGPKPPFPRDHTDGPVCILKTISNDRLQVVAFGPWQY